MTDPFVLGVGLAGLFFMAAGATFLVARASPKQKKAALIKKLCALVDDPGYSSMTCVEINLSLGVTDQVGRKIIFEEMMRLINEGRLVATEERSGPKLYYSKVVCK